MHVDQPPPKPSFADDPNFLASLSDLDSGLLEGDEKIRPSAPRVPALRVSTPPAGPGGHPDLAIDLAEAFEFPAAAPRLPVPSPPAKVPAPAAPLSRPMAARPTAGSTREPAVVLPEIVPPRPGGRRPLLDLFPPPPGGVSEPPDLGIGIAPPPGIAVREHAPRLEPVPGAAAPPVTYEPYYGLAEKPFTLSTDPKFLYHSTAHDYAAQDLLSVERLLK